MTTANYIRNFDSAIRLNRNAMQLLEVYRWCEQHLGVKYKDWFIYDVKDYAFSSPAHPNRCVIYIKSAKSATLFRLRWMDVIEYNVDKPL